MSIRSLIFTMAQSPGSTSTRASPESTSRALSSWPLYDSFTEVIFRGSACPSWLSATTPCLTVMK